LLFRFIHLQGSLAGQDFWATPGGGLEDGETFEQAAIRELAEETGIQVTDIGPEISRREVEFQLPDGERVIADERYFAIRIDDLPALSRDRWTALETEVMADWRWWSAEELALTPETVWPENLLAMLSATSPQ
jgi:8-oxo-dGTP pyrophosphatase MutT (NUDIX family)